MLLSNSDYPSRPSGLGGHHFGFFREVRRDSKGFTEDVTDFTETHPTRIIPQSLRPTSDETAFRPRNGDQPITKPGAIP